MISSQTGEIRISPTLKVLPSDDPDRIVDSIISKRDAWMDHEGRSWTILSLTPFVYNEYEILSTLRFCEDTLFSIDFTVSDDRFGSSWSEWSEEKELALKAIHDNLLNEILGSNREFSWGTVRSVFDRKGGCSIFGIDYTNREQNAAEQPASRSSVKNK